MVERFDFRVDVEQGTQVSIRYGSKLSRYGARAAKIDRFDIDQNQVDMGPGSQNRSISKYLVWRDVQPISNGPVY
jgi:hypothetical protein